jgi:hypothetical protein
MKALFDSSSNLVGWISDDQKHIWNTNMQWVGFVAGQNAWSARGAEWIGPVINGNIHDRQGHTIAWSNSNVGTVMPPIRPMTPMMPMTPMSPMRPMSPMKPMTPMAPMGGWSRASFDEAFG